MYRGTYQLGQSVPLTLLCVNGSDVAVNPENPPVISVSKAGTYAVRYKPIGAISQGRQTGLFAFNLFLDGNYSAGYWNVRYFYKAGSVIQVVFDNFRVIAGGHADGAVTSLHHWERPEANFIVQVLDEGKIAKGKNPYL